MLSFRNVLNKFSNCKVNKRFFHEPNKYIFVCDTNNKLINNLRAKKIESLKSNGGNFPSLYGRTLLHPYSQHNVANYAHEYYSTAKPMLLGEYPIQFFGSEIHSHDKTIDDTIDEDNHTIILFPEQIKIKNIKKENIPHIVYLCSNNDSESILTKYDNRIEKMKGINLYFFIDISNIDRFLLLFQWFGYCFQNAKRNNNKFEVNYIFSSGNLKNEQQSNIIITNGNYRKVISQSISRREIDHIVWDIIRVNPDDDYS